MKKLKQFDTLVIEEMTKQQFHEPTHGQTYFELVYILSGTGLHYLNETAVPYEADDFFLISPVDTHYLEIRDETHFGVVKFTDAYFAANRRLTPDSLLQVLPDTMMLNRSFKEGKPAVDANFKPILRRTIMNLMESKSRRDLDRSPFIFHQILSVFSIFQESWKSNFPYAPSAPGRDSLITYIHQQIYDPSKVSIKHIAETFNVSPNYFSSFFKANFGIPYRDYLNNYRIKLIENRVKTGSSLRQISEEFGFTDEAHLSHFFKKHQGMTVRAFRDKAPNTHSS